jgi:hypothetical protein
VARPSLPVTRPRPEEHPRLSVQGNVRSRRLSYLRAEAAGVGLSSAAGVLHSLETLGYSPRKSCTSEPFRVTNSSDDKENL